MSDETASTDEATAAVADETKAHEETVAYERFQKVNAQAKAEKARAAEFEKKLAALQAQIDDRESAGLPELERLKKDMERAEKRAAEAEARAEKQEQAAVRAGRERLVLSAAAAAGFDEADDALRYPEHVNLDEIETQADAERAVKRLAKARPKLLKADGPQLPGRVLKDGQRTTEERPRGAIDAEAEANMLAEGLGSLMKNRWQSV
jgi:hypothetical protein